MVKQHLKSAFFYVTSKLKITKLKIINI